MSVRDMARSIRAPRPTPSATLRATDAQETRDPFFRAAVQEQKHLVLGGAHFVAELGQNLRPQRRRVVDERLEPAPGHAPDADLRDRLGGEQVPVPERQPDHVPGEDEADDGAPAVREDAEHPQHPPRDLEDVVGRIALPEHRPLGREGFARLRAEQRLEGVVRLRFPGEGIAAGALACVEAVKAYMVALPFGSVPARRAPPCNGHAGPMVTPRAIV